MSSVRNKRLLDEAAAIKTRFAGIDTRFPPGMVALGPSIAANGANWGPRDSTVFGMSPLGKIGVGGFSRSSLKTNPAYASIGVAGFVINDAAGSPGWAGYFDVQHELGAQQTVGAEFAVKNKGANVASSPYSRAGGAIGIWLAGGGDASYGGASTNPNNAAIAIIRNSNTWNTGIVFESTALTGSDGTTGTATAMLMGKGHQFRWNTPSDTAGAFIRSDVATTGKDMGLLFQDGISKFINTTGTASFAARHNDNAINYLEVSDGLTGTPAQLIVRTTGSDTNADLQLVPLGTGVLRFGTFTTNADAAITGYVTIRDSGGTLRKLATIA